MGKRGFLLVSLLLGLLSLLARVASIYLVFRYNKYAYFMEPEQFALRWTLALLLLPIIVIGLATVCSSFFSK